MKKIPHQDDARSTAERLEPLLRNPDAQCRAQGWELLRALNQQGVARWLDLSQTSLCHDDLSSLNLQKINLSGAFLHGVDLRGADIRGARLGPPKKKLRQAMGEMLNEVMVSLLRTVWVLGGLLLLSLFTLGWKGAIVLTLVVLGIFVGGVAAFEALVVLTWPFVILLARHQQLARTVWDRQTRFPIDIRRGLLWALRPK